MLYLAARAKARGICRGSCAIVCFVLGEEFSWWAFALYIDLLSFWGILFFVVDVDILVYCSFSNMKNLKEYLILLFEKITLSYITRLN